MIVTTINNVASLLLLMALGFALAGTAFFKKNNASAVLNTFLTKVALPVYLFYNMTTNFSSRSEFLSIMKNLPAPVLIIAFEIVVGFLLALALRVRRGRKGAFTVGCALSNVVFIGFPVVQGIFGNAITPTAMVYYIINTVVFWTVGTYLLRSDSGEKVKFLSVSNLKKILSPAMIGLLTGIVFALLEIPLPVFLKSGIKSLSATCSPLGMLFIGTVIREVSFKENGFARDIIALFAARYIAMPLLLGLLLSVLPLDIEVKKTYYLLSLMPAMTQAGIMAKAYGGDFRFTSMWIAVSSVLGVVSLPAYVWLMQRIFGA